MTNSTLRRSFAALILGTAGLLWPASASAVTIPVDDDAMVYQTNSTFNYGHRHILDVVGTSSANRWAYISFGDITAFLPSGTTSADVKKAFIHVYVNTVTAGGNIDVFKVTSSWAEGTKNGATETGTITWGTKPTDTGTALNASPYALATTDEAEFISIDVTSAVQDWITSPSTNYGIVIKPNGTAVNIYLDSKENDGTNGGVATGTSKAPVLDIQLQPYNASLSAIAAGTWTGANSINTLGTVTSGTWAGTSIALANGGTGATTASGARSALGLAIGTDVQPWNANLDDLASGSVNGSFVGSGIDASNITTGTLTLSNDATFNGVRIGLGVGTFRFYNTAIGSNTLSNNTDGTFNTAVGGNALANNTTGSDNTAVGGEALHSNTTGIANTALGLYALRYNSEGTENTATGGGALRENTTGNSNTGCGIIALGSNTTGSLNTAIGASALAFNTTGGNNVAGGYEALYFNTTGTNNIALGNGAGAFQANGTTQLNTASNSIYIGNNSKGYNNSDSNSIVIGYNAVGEGANKTVIGNSSTTGTHIYGSLTATAPTAAAGTNNTALATTAFVTVANAQSNSGITPFADGTYHFYNDGTSGNVTAITITKGIVTNVTTAP